MASNKATFPVELGELRVPGEVTIEVRINKKHVAILRMNGIDDEAQKNLVGQELQTYIEMLGFGDYEI